MAKIPQPYTIEERDDSKTFRLTLNYTCGLPHSICQQWRRRSFQSFPDELAQHRTPKTMDWARIGANALIAFYTRELESAKTERILARQISTIEDFAGDMFLEGAAHLTRWAEKGHALKPKTISQHRRHLVNYLIPKFGQYRLDEIRQIGRAHV